MNIQNGIIKNMLLAVAAGMAIVGCQKLNHPGVGDYPKDSNPPGGPLKFYAAMDGTNVDSIRANFGTSTNVTFVAGAGGKAMQAGANGYITYPSANDFSKSTSFTVAFWLSRPGPNTAGAGTAFAFGLSTNKSIWTYQDMFLEFEDAGNPSTTDSAACKFYLNDQWFEFIKVKKTNGQDSIDKRLPKVLDGNWHHLAFSFDQPSSTLTVYLDGKAYTNLPPGFGKFTNNNGKVDFSQVGGLVVGGVGSYGVSKSPSDIGQTWMGNFGGKIDQFRLYGTALAATDVAALYANKQ